jgi:hypothetical protein
VNAARNRNDLDQLDDTLDMAASPKSKAVALTARGCLPIITVLLLIATLLSAGRPVAAVATTACDPETVMDHRLDELGRGGYPWVIRPDPIDDEHHAGFTMFGEPLVVISSAVTCEQMPTVVNHEWLHVRQARAFPENTERAFGGPEEIELIADCGSQLLGSTYTPYLSLHRQATGERGCPAEELASAQWLLTTDS